MLGGFVILAILLCIGLISLRAAYRACCTYTITYMIRGTSPAARITYYPGDSLLGRQATPIDTQAPLPWEMHIQSDGFFHRRSATVQATGAPADSLTCEIWINGRLAVTRTDTETTGCGYDPEANPLP